MSPAVPRRPLIAANWKMNKLRADAESFCRALRAGTGGDETAAVDVLVCPPTILLGTVAAGLGGSVVEWGGQDVHAEPSGAYTGDVAAVQLADFGCRWVLCGHSERRRDHHEDDALVARKAATARAHGLEPVVCVGESQQERRAGATFEVLGRQLDALLDGLGDVEEGPGLTLAYEPIWAIGTGDTATPTMAQEAHAFLRRRLTERLGDERAEAIRLLYGGSAKPGNVAELIVEADIDGFLVGGASLDADDFLAIISSSAAAAG
ncbi:MAG: triose-phosphate isomerase [Acidobacteriota bacterium]